MKKLFSSLFLSVAVLSAVLVPVSSQAQVLPPGCTSTIGYSGTTGAKCDIYVVASCVSFTRDLTLGSTGEDVKRLNNLMWKNGFGPTGNPSDDAPVLADQTYFGDPTQNAVKSFQREFSISPDSGYVGPITRQKLNELYPCSVPTPTDLTISAPDDENQDRVIFVDEDGGDQVEIFTFNLENTSGGDLEVRDLPINIGRTASGYGPNVSIDEVILVFEGEEVGSESVPSTCGNGCAIVFDDIDVTIDARDEVEFQVEVSTNDMDFSGDNLYDVQATLLLDGLNVEDSSGDRVPVSRMLVDGANYGGVITFADEDEQGEGRPVITKVSANISTIYNDGSSPDLQSRFVVDVKAIDGDIYIPNQGGYGFLYDFVHTNPPVYIKDIPYRTLSKAVTSSADRIDGKNHDYFVIKEGQTERFTLIDTLDGDRSIPGIYYGRLISMRYSATPTIGGERNFAIAPVITTPNIYIVGERSAYITSVTQNAQDKSLFMMSGERLLGGTIYVDSVSVSSVGSQTNTVRDFRANLAAGTHKVQIRNSPLGNSNEVYFDVEGVNPLTPVITDVEKTGPGTVINVGDGMDVEGRNLKGTFGKVWLVNSAGQKGLIRDHAAMFDDVMQMTMPTRVCSNGLPTISNCSVLFNVVYGTYKVYVETNNGKSNEFVFTIGQTSGQIVLTAPNGGERWLRNDRITDTLSGALSSKPITWSGVNSESRLVQAYLEKYQNGSFVTVGRALPFGYGSIVWVVGVVSDKDCQDANYQLPNYCYNRNNMQLVAPGSYYIRVVDPVSGTSDRSNQPFEIYTEGSNINPSISVQFPNGGETISAGAQVDIKWSKNFSTSKVTHVDLIGTNGSFTKLTPMAGISGNASSFSATIPENLAAGTYRARVTVCPEANQMPGGYNCIDESNSSFQVIPKDNVPFATITAPRATNPVTVWRRGSSANTTVTWTPRAGMNLNVVHLTLINQSTGAEKTLATNLPANSGSYTFYLPQSGQNVGNRSVPVGPVVGAGNYKLRITVCPKEFYGYAGDNRCNSQSGAFGIYEPTTSMNSTKVQQVGTVIQAIASLFGF